MRVLTSRQKAWVDAYFDCFNASEAARRAGYSEKTAGSQGHRLLKDAEKYDENVPISIYFSQCLNEQTMSAEEVRRRLAEQARAEYAEYINDDGTVDLIAMKRGGKMHLIRAIRETQFGQVVEFYDAQAALVHIGKAHGLFREVQEVTGQEGGPLRIIIDR